MGLAIKGKKVIGLALNGNKLLGEAKNGKVIWRFFVASKLWESDQSGTLQNLQMDDNGLLYAIDGNNINRIGKNDGSVYATKNDTDGYIGDLVFNSSQGYVNFVGKTAYWNALNYSNIQRVHSGKNSLTSSSSSVSVISDVIQSNYELGSYKVTLVAYNNGYIDVVNNSNTGNSYQIDHNYPASSSPNYLFALDNMGTDSTFNAGDFIAYGSSNVNAFNANSSSSVLTLSGDSDIFKGDSKVTISPIGTDGNEDFYLLQTSAYNELFSVSKSSSTINVKYLTYFSPLSTNNKVTDLAIDYDNYGKYVSNVTKSLDGTNSDASLANLPYKFTAYDSELGTDGQEHVYALKYNSAGSNNWTTARHEKLIDIDKGWSVSKMIKKGDNLYIGENGSSNNYRVENYQISTLTYSGLLNNFDLTNSDNGGSPLYPNSIAVSASNYAVATPPNSTNKGNLLKSMCIDGYTYVSQINTTGAQQVCSIPYENSGLFVLENSKLSYRNYASLGTINQYLSNPGISGSDPMGVTNFGDTAYAGASLGSTGTLFWQTSNGTNGTNSSMGLTDNKGSFVNNNPIKGDKYYYYISPTNKIIMRFLYDGSNITKNNFVDSGDTTSDTIAIAKNSNFMYGTKNVAGTKIYVTTPLTSDNFKLIRTIDLNSDFYLLDLASDGLGNFVALAYSSTYQKVIISFYDSTGKFIANNIFSDTYSSLPKGHLTIDPQNNNIGIVVGDSFQLWSFGNANFSSKDAPIPTTIMPSTTTTTQYVPPYVPPTTNYLIHYYIDCKKTVSWISSIPSRAEGYFVGEYLGTVPGSGYGSLNVTVTQGVSASWPVSYANGGNQVFNNKNQHSYTYRYDGSGTIYWNGYNFSMSGGRIASTQ